MPIAWRPRIQLPGRRRHHPSVLQFQPFPGYISLFLGPGQDPRHLPPTEQHAEKLKNVRTYKILITVLTIS